MIKTVLQPQIIEMNQYNSTKSKPVLVYFLAIILLIAAPGFYFRILDKNITTLLLNTAGLFSLFLLPIVFFRNHLKIYTWLLLPIILLGTFNFACILFYKMPITDGIIIVAINTNRYEFQELAKGFLLPFILILVLYVGIYFICLRKVPNTISLKTGSVFSILSLFIILLLPFFESSDHGYFRNLKARYYTIFPTSFIYSASNVYTQYNLMNATEEDRIHFKFNATQLQLTNQQQIYILVIGEDRKSVV